MGHGPHANAWSAHASYSGTRSVTNPWCPREPSSVATTYSTSSGSSVDGYTSRAEAAEQQRHLAPVTDRLVGEHPNSGHTQASRHEQEVAASRIHLERPPEWPEHVDPVARPEMGEPVGAPPDDPIVDRDDPSDGVCRVQRERPAQHEPGIVPRAHVHELPGP